MLRVRFPMRKKLLKFLIPKVEELDSVLQWPPGGRAGVVVHGGEAAPEQGLQHSGLVLATAHGDHPGVGHCRKIVAAAARPATTADEPAFDQHPGCLADRAATGMELVGQLLGGELGIGRDHQDPEDAPEHPGAAHALHHGSEIFDKRALVIVHARPFPAVHSCMFGTFSQD